MRRHMTAELAGSPFLPSPRPPAVEGGGWADFSAGSPVPRPRRSLEDGTGRPPNLTERDLELIRHLAEGRSTSQIAAAMSVTGHTARTRIRRVQRKLAAPHREDVVGEARRQLGAV